MSKNLLKLQEMMDQRWSYKGEILLFQASKKEGDKTILATDKRWIEFETPFILNCFLEDCRPADAAVVAKSVYTELTLPDPKSDEIMSKLKGVLIENIDKVRENKEYVPQAQMVSKTVQTLINLTKMELEVLKLRNK